jgi:hypothetical protein
VPSAEALRLLPAVHVDEAEARDLSHGRPLRRLVGEAPFHRAIDPAGALVAVVAPAEGGARPVRVFPRP